MAGSLALCSEVTWLRFQDPPRVVANHFAHHFQVFSLYFRISDASSTGGFEGFWEGLSVGVTVAGAWETNGMDRRAMFEVISKLSRLEGSLCPQSGDLGILAGFLTT